MKLVMLAALPALCLALPTFQPARPPPPTFAAPPASFAKFAPPAPPPPVFAAPPAPRKFVPAPPPPPQFSVPAPPPPSKFVPAAPPAPVSQDCVYSSWTPWSQCTAACDATAFISRTRTVLKEASGYGQPCQPSQLEEWQECRGEPCARDCVMGDWTAWSTCSAQCGSGQRQRWRQIASQPIAGGAPCGQTEEIEPCNLKPCAVDCQMGPWSAWSQCSSDCGEGRRQRLRSVQIPAAFGGLPCGPAEEWEACNNGPCPRDCVLGDWAPWSQCPSCGQASRTRSRSIVEQGAFGGAICDFNGLSETESCNLSPCAVDCVMQQWSQWSQCSSDCGEGRRQRLRGVITPAAFGGLSCGPAEEWEQCNNGPCPRDCVLGDWAPWSQCPACGQASRTRSRSIIEQGAFGGAICDFNGLSETESCNLSPCAIDCVMTQWSAWSQCSSDCGEGRRQRLRSVQTPAAFGGLPCGPAEEWEQCNNGPCPRDCVLGDWAPWSSCPACGQASRSRSRSIIEQGAFGGAQCDFNGLSESESCNLPSCAVDCAVSPWSAWSACSAECGSGRQQRLRSILTPAANGGAACPALEDWRQCNNGPCRQPSICDGVRGTRYFATGCTPEFVLCSAGQEHHKICPEPSRFDLASSTCRLPQEIPACKPTALPVANPAPAPAPAPSLISRIGSFFSYDSVPDETLPSPAPADTTASVKGAPAFRPL